MTAVWWISKIMPGIVIELQHLEKMPSCGVCSSMGTFFSPHGFVMKL